MCCVLIEKLTLSFSTNICTNEWIKGSSLQDVPTEEEYASLSDLKQELLNDILTILPPVAVGADAEPVAYLVTVDAMVFFPAYCRQSRLYEYHGYPQFQAIPLRSSLAQSHQRIDTTILYKHILQITRAAAESVADKSELWVRVFRLNGKALRSRGGMVFDGMILTNGTDVYLKHANAHRRDSTRKSKATLHAEVKQMYIDNHLPELRSTPNIVAIDPNKRDILYFQDRNSNSNLRYTSNQRAKETGSRHYRKQREALRSSHGIDVIESRIPVATPYLGVRGADKPHPEIVKLIGC
ncbi:hypothetical protein SeLEV6574_g06964 [Synchytrium endobioticum]|uniref:Uncharacterized protein n=1 Tax=Synchytrium endobioticum TaxID=286115 RepID=A0A507CM13_9FUNG|nr:hypothetical protein SeLEV6574_g06964 [Synchytrium endobioticum]